MYATESHGALTKVDGDMLEDRGGDGNTDIAAATCVRKRDRKKCNETSATPVNPAMTPVNSNFQIYGPTLFVDCLKLRDVFGGRTGGWGQ